ncbi:MAG: NAD-binding protein [Actinomycetota bacterium]|nr:NAD-binding protein [Actinomycetota bacterium]
MRAIVVGTGASARDLIRRLGDNWDITLVDPQEEQLAAASRIRDVRTVLGDGSSAVVLREAGIEKAMVVVAATSHDDVNLEVARIAQAAGVEQVVALVRDPDRREEYREIGVDIVTPAFLAARAMDVAMEPRKVVSTSFAKGRAEAIEFEITPDSPVQGKALKEIHSELWVVAAILRDDKLIVPHGTTRLLTGDRVTVVGSASDFSQVVRTFAGGVSRFPLTFGRNVVVAMESREDRYGVVAEAAYFVRNSNADGLIVVHRDPKFIKSVAGAEEMTSLSTTLSDEDLGVAVSLRPVAGDVIDGILAVAADESVGAIAAPMAIRSFSRPYSAMPSLINKFAPAGVPLLLTRGAATFNEIVAPARRTIAGDTAGRAAIDIARRAGMKVVGVAVANPLFMGSDDLMQMRDATAWLRREASVQDVEVERHVVRGNLVKVLAEVNRADSLLVVSMPKGRLSRIRPGTAVWAASRGQGSVLFVPTAG